MNKCKNSSEMDLINMHESKLLKEKKINKKIAKITTKRKRKGRYTSLIWMHLEVR